MNFYKSLSFVFLFIPLSSVFAETSIDFSYQDLEKMILSSHPSVRNSQYNLDIAEDKRKQADYARYPRLNFRLGGFPIAPYLYMDKHYSLSADWSQWQPTLQMSLGMDIPIYDFGRTSNLQKAAEYNLAVEEANLDITKSNILFQVKQLYWGYLSYNSYKKYIFDVTLPEFEKLVNKKEKRFNEGKIKRNELETSRIDYLDMKRNLSYIERKKQSLDSQLGLLTNKDSMEELNIRFKVKYLYELPIEIQPYSYYLASARMNNPFFKKAENESLAAQFYAEYQKSTIWPVIAFSVYTSYTLLNFTRQSDFSSDVYPDRGWKFGFGFSLTWSLNVWDHLVNYDLAQKNYLKLMEGVKQANRQLEMQLEESYHDLDYQNTQLNYQQEMLTIAQRNFIFTNKAEGTGTATLDDVGNTLRTLFARLRAYYDQVYSFNLAVGNFEKLLGRNLVDYSSAEQKEIQNEILLEDSGDNV